MWYVNRLLKKKKGAVVSFILFITGGYEKKILTLLPGSHIDLRTLSNITAEYYIWPFPREDEIQSVAFYLKFDWKMDDRHLPSDACGCLLWTVWHRWHQCKLSCLTSSVVLFFPHGNLTAEMQTSYRYPSGTGLRRPFLFVLY